MENSAEKIKWITKKISVLPTLPTIVSEIIKLVSDPRTSVQDLTRVISIDQSLATRILKIVNSAYYGFPQQISTINHALVILGFNEIRNIAFTTSVLESFSDNDDSGFFCRERFWQHSIGCALGSKMLAKMLRYRVSGEVFIAGLIHDIGKVIFDQYIHELFIEALKKADLENISIYEAEKKVIGIAHTDIGKWLAEQWNLPLRIKEAIELHHTPDKALINPQITAIVHLSDILTKMNLVGFSGDNKVIPPHPVIWKNLKSLKPDLNESHLNYFSSVFREEIERSRALFDILYKE